MKKVFLYLIAVPTFVVGVLFVYGATLVGLARDPGIDTEWHFRATWVDWFAERWLYSTTVGHGLVLGAMLAWMWGELWLGLLLWLLAPAAHLLNYGMAWLRDLDPYRDAEHERSAYSQTDEDHDHAGH